MHELPHGCEFVQYLQQERAAGSRAGLGSANADSGFGAAAAGSVDDAGLRFARGG